MLAANEARQLGYGGVSRVSRACGLSRVTITKGMEELGHPPLEEGRTRRPGGGRPPLVRLDPDLPCVLEGLVEPLARGDPESPLRWTSKSTRVLAAELTAQRHPVSHEKVAQLLRELDYSLQGNRKTEEGSDHPDRDAQFQHINEQVRKALTARDDQLSPLTPRRRSSLETTRMWADSGGKAKSPQHVNGHDFPDPSVPRAYPYGIYDLARNAGFVNLGTDHDTGAFAVASIRGWWRFEGRRLYPNARQSVDHGGWRRQQWLSAAPVEAGAARHWRTSTGLSILVCHFPPGTSKWNKVEHRLFSFISSNWRGEPLRDYETVVRLIAGTTTAKGLQVTCRLDRRRYSVGRKVSDQEFATINLKPHAFHGEWNYRIRPRKTRKM